MIASPPRPPIDDQQDIDALIEEARRRARRRRRRYGACAMIAAAASVAVFLSIGDQAGTDQPRADAAPPPGAAGGLPPALKNGPITIMSDRSNRPGNWNPRPNYYSLSTIGPAGRMLPLVRCPDGVTWCGDILAVDWSADGTRLALSVTSYGAHNPYNGIRVITPSTGEDRELLGSQKCRCTSFDLDWSRDGSKLAFVSDPHARQEGHGTIYLINNDGTGRTELSTGTRGYDASPSWSPDGGQIAYSSFGPKLHHPIIPGQDPVTDDSSIYVIGVDGSHRTLLAKDAAAPAWSPDGTTIAYRTNCGIKLITPAGVDVTPPSGRRCDAIGVSGAPVWSPDGRKIAIGTLDRGTYVINADGTHLTRLTTKTLAVFQGQQPRPSWQPLQ